MSVQQIQHAPNLILFHDAEAQPNPLVYHWFMHGQYRWQEARKDESAADLWTRVLLEINEQRVTLARNRMTVLDSNVLVTVYAGDLEPASLQKLEKRHMREHICLGLQRIAGTRFNNQSDSVAAVKALQLLGELTGVLIPKGRGRARVVKDANQTQAPSAMTR